MSSVEPELGHIQGDEQEEEEAGGRECACRQGGGDVGARLDGGGLLGVGLGVGFGWGLGSVPLPGRRHPVWHLFRLAHTEPKPGSVEGRGGGQLGQQRVTPIKPL